MAQSLDALLDEDEMTFDDIAKEISKKPAYRAPEPTIAEVSPTPQIQPVAKQASLPKQTEYIANDGIDPFEGSPMPDDDGDTDNVAGDTSSRPALPSRNDYEIDDMTEAWCELIPEIMDDATVEAGKFFYAKRFKPEMAYKVRESYMAKMYQTGQLDEKERNMLKRAEDEIRAFENGRGKFESQAHIQDKFKEYQVKALKSMMAKKKKQRSPSEIIVWTMTMQMANIARLVMLADEPSVKK